ncbi:MAG: diguanylate cyclase [Candidatus Aminicenantes bacterium]|nr:diguanylate cyclase [Candidatus Aminicenantes bacterium]
MKGDGSIPRRRKRALAAILLFAAAGILQGRNATIEELKLRLNDPRHDRLGTLRHLEEALILRGSREQARQDYRSALATYEEAISILKEHGNIPPTVALLINLGTAQIILGEYDRAVEVLLRALSAAEKGDDPTLISSSAYLLGYAHRDLKNYDLAMSYFLKSRDTAQSSGNTPQVIMAQNEIGNVQVFSGQYAEAATSKEEALKLARDNGDIEILSNVLNDIGVLHLEMDRPARALPYLRESLSIGRKLNNARTIIIALQNIADAQRRTGRLEESAAGLKEARALAEKSGLEPLAAETRRHLSATFEAMGDYPRALAEYHGYQETWEQLFTREKSKQIAEMQTLYEVEKGRRENESLRREQELGALALTKQRSQRNFLFFTALLVLILAGVLYNRFLFKSRANRRLEEANAKITAQQAKLEEAYLRAEELARHDPLTGLPNRRAALGVIEREKSRFARGRKPFALIMADIDGFKTINDTVGHDAGDYLLKAAAELFSRSIRAQDSVARWGGDEFLFLLPETGMDGARIFCQGIAAKTAAADFRFKGQSLQISASLGAAVYDSEDRNIEECLREADQDMYRRKPARRG